MSYMTSMTSYFPYKYKKENIKPARKFVISESDESKNVTSLLNFHLFSCLKMF